MTSQAALFIGLMVAILAACGAFIAWRLRRVTTRRAEAERRAASAFEAMHSTSRRLRETLEQSAVDPHVSPGERLQRRYGGWKSKGPRDHREGTS